MHDLIVIGTGGVGSAVMAQAARRGLRVLGFDRHRPPHSFGSSHGESRVIRRSYFEHPDYVPLLSRAYELWDQLNRETGQQLFVRSGLVYYLTPDGRVSAGVRGSAAEYGLELNSASADEAARRWPQFVVPHGREVLYEPDAGYLRVEDCVAAQHEMAIQAGGECATEEVISWAATESGVAVRSACGTWSAERLIIAAGSWSHSMLHAPGLPLRVVHKQLHWFPSSPSAAAAGESACFFYEVNDGYFYGFPDLGNGIKVAEHSGGIRLNRPEEGYDFADPQDNERVTAFVNEYLNGAQAVSAQTASCRYTMTPDEHFVIDRHPQHDCVTFAAGLSGHGFKFAPALAELLLDLSLEGSTSHNIDFLSWDRF